MSLVSHDAHADAPPADATSPRAAAAALRNRARLTDDDDEPVKRVKRRPSTSHLKAVPETLAEREAIKAAAETFAATLDQSRPFSKGELERFGRALLEQMGQPEQFLGFAMVLVGNFFWKRQFLATPFERRLLLLPHCLKHAEGCPAEYDEFGLDCEKCGACSIADYKVRAEQLGYKVLVAEGSPIVLKIIVGGYVDSILGVACLNVLEKAIDKVLIAGVPSYAVPLHSGDCKNTKMDEAWIWEVLEQYEPLPEPPTHSYLPLMRAGNRMFDDAATFARLLPPVRTKTPVAAASPLGTCERISYEWLQQGGKRSRPFITLAAYDAMTGARVAAGGSAGDGDDAFRENDLGGGLFSDGVGRVAMAIEAFHKASLAHDDIEDGDLFRYGRDTLHRTHGVGQAINVGDHLIGVGYRLVTAARGEIGAEAAADILDRMAAAHVRLCDGQGAEMAWQANPDLTLTPLDALQIYALKTSPAFEAALYAGIRLAGPAEPYQETITGFCRQIGVGFQILNDLKDWRGDDNNKLVAGQDALSLRPTVLLALAMQAATPEQQTAIRAAHLGSEAPGVRMNRLRRLYTDLHVFDTAAALVEKSRARAESLADTVEPDSLRRLLHFFIETILEPEETATPPQRALVSLPIVR